MTRNLLALVAGILFGFGLSLSHMVDPNKVLAFLDVVGPWDPSLALVMGGAVAAALPGFRLARRQPRPWCEPRFHWPERRDIDRRLVGGAAIFGLGWGLAGYCPGPGVAALAIHPAEAVPFLLATVIGGLAVQAWQTRERAALSDG